MSLEHVGDGRLLSGRDELFSFFAIEVGAAAAEAVLYGLLHRLVLHFGHEVEDVFHAACKTFGLVGAIKLAFVGECPVLWTLEVHYCNDRGEEYPFGGFAVYLAAQAMFPQGALPFGGGAAHVTDGHGELLWHGF